MNHRFSMVWLLMALLLMETGYGQQDHSDNKKLQVDRQWLTEAVESRWISHQTYNSKIARAKVSYHVYLPPEYSRIPEQKFPVLYWLHGTQGGITGIRPVARMFHSAMIDGDVPPMIIVFVNGLHAHLWTDSKDGSRPVETIFVEELIPHIDKSLRTIARREGRILEGFSMGGNGAARIGFKHLDTFSHISILAAGPLDLEFRGPRADGNPLRESILETVCGGDMEYYRQSHPKTVAKQQAKQIARSKPRVRIVVGEKDRSQALSEGFHDHLVKLGIDHEYVVVPRAGHDAAKLFAHLKSKRFYQVRPETEETARNKKVEKTKILTEERAFSR